MNRTYTLLAPPRPAKTSSINLTSTLVGLAVLVLLAVLVPAAGWAAGAPAKKKASLAQKDKGAAAVPAAAPAEAPAAGSAEKGVSTPPAGSSPMADLKKSNAALDKALTKNRPNWSPEAELQRTPKQRDEFVNTLRKLVERSYLKQIHGNANYNIKYETETKKDGEATVTA